MIEASQKIQIDNGKNVDNIYENDDHIIYLHTAFYKKMNRLKKCTRFY